MVRSPSVLAVITAFLRNNNWPKATLPLALCFKCHRLLVVGQKYQVDQVCKDQLSMAECQDKQEKRKRQWEEQQNEQDEDIAGEATKASGLLLFGGENHDDGDCCVRNENVSIYLFSPSVKELQMGSKTTLVMDGNPLLLTRAYSQAVCCFPVTVNVEPSLPAACSFLASFAFVPKIQNAQMVPLGFSQSILKFKLGFDKLFDNLQLATSSSQLPSAAGFSKDIVIEVLCCSRPVPAFP